MVKPTKQQKLEIVSKFKVNPTAGILALIDFCGDMMGKVMQSQTTEQIAAMREEMIEIVKSVRGEKGDAGDRGEIGEPGYSPVRGEDYMTDDDFDFMRSIIKGDPGDKGDQGDKGETGEAGHTPVKGEDYFTDFEIHMISEQAAKLIPPPKDGKNGRDGKDGSPDTGGQIVGKINALPTNDAKMMIDASHIKNLEAYVKRFLPSGKNESRSARMGRGTGSIAQVYDLSSQCNGSNKVFTIPTNSRVLGLWSTQFPLVYKPGTDFTVAGTTLTLSAGVGAPEEGQTLIVIYAE